jgi:hypothetical protein
MPEEDRVSRLDVERRRFGGTVVSVSTHSGSISVSGPLLDNFNLDLAVEWASHVLNGWDFPADRWQARRRIIEANRGITK